MTVSRSQGGPEINVNLLILGVTITIMIVIGVWSLSRRGAGAAPAPAAVAKQRSDLFQQMAWKCRGDFSRLSPDDQAALQQATGGNGALVIQETAMHYGIH